MIKIKCPATTANLGPGFDCLGMALNLYNEFTFEENIDFAFEGFLPEYCNNDNLVLISYLEAFKFQNEQPIKVKIGMITNVPPSRGLGSSATCIIGGILGANHFLNNKLSNEDIITLATKIEGHPDNVAPCLLGGLVASFVDDSVKYVKYDVSDKVKIMALIPDFPLSTSLSRSVLPKNITISDAVYNMSRAVNIPYAFIKGDISLINSCMKDKLHQDYRFPLIMESNLFIDYAEKNNITIVISGAGPTLLMISDKQLDISLKTKHQWLYLPLNVSKEGSFYETR